MTAALCSRLSELLFQKVVLIQKSCQSILLYTSKQGGITNEVSRPHPKRVPIVTYKGKMWSAVGLIYDRSSQVDFGEGAAVNQMSLMGTLPFMGTSCRVSACIRGKGCCQEMLP